MKEVVSYDLLLGENLFLGKLLLFMDARNRPNLKLSLGYKATTQILRRDPDRYDNRAGEIIREKSTKHGESIEYSYKFVDKKLECKNETRDGSIERTFYDINIPTDAPLFLIRLSGKIPLKSKGSPKTPIMLDSDLPESDSIVLSFTFPGDNGKPWNDLLMVGQETQVTEFKLPDAIKPNVFFILASHDPHPRNDGVSIWIPEMHKITKRT